MIIKRSLARQTLPARRRIIDTRSLQSESLERPAGLTQRPLLRAAAPHLGMGQSVCERGLFELYNGMKRRRSAVEKALIAILRLAPTCGLLAEAMATK